MRRRNLLGKTGPIYVFKSAKTSVTGITPASSSFTINITSTTDGSNSTYSASYTGAMISAVTTAATYITVKTYINTNTANTKSGTITLTQANSNKTITINLSQQADYITNTNDATKNTTLSKHLVSIANINAYGRDCNGWPFYNYTQLTIKGGVYEIYKQQITRTTYYKSGNSKSSLISDKTITGDVAQNQTMYLTFKTTALDLQEQQSGSQTVYDSQIDYYQSSRTEYIDYDNITLTINVNGIKSQTDDCDVDIDGGNTCCGSSYYASINWGYNSQTGTTNNAIYGKNCCYTLD